MTSKLWPPPDSRATEASIRPDLGLAACMAAAKRGEIQPANQAVTPEYADALYAWAVVACETARWSDLRLALDHLATFEADSSRVLRARLAWETATGDFRAAAATARQLTDRTPDDAELVFLWGQALLGTGSVAEARDLIHLARRVASSDLARWSHVVDWCDAEVAASQKGQGPERPPI